MQVSGFVTAGGQSSRMGRDKAWLEIGGRALIERVLDALRAVASEVVIIANTPVYERLGVAVIADANPGIGPLEAIRVALAHSRTPWVILVGCDLPFVTPDLFAYLLSVAEQQERAESPAVAVVPQNGAGLPEPLCALYSTAALAAVTELIGEGERKVSRLFARVKTQFVPFAALRALAGAEAFFANINTPKEYREAGGGEIEADARNL